VETDAENKGDELSAPAEILAASEQAPRDLLVKLRWSQEKPNLP